MIDRDRVLALPAMGALFLVPLLFAREVYDFTRWPRLLALQVCVILGLAGLILLRNKLRFRGSFDLPILAFVGWCTASTLWAVNPVEATIQLVSTVTMAAVYLYTSRLAGEETLRKLVWVWSLSGLIVAAIGIGQYLGYDPFVVPSAGHPSSTFGYRNYVATYLIISIPVVLCFAAVERTPHRSALMAISASLMMLLLLYTRTRGAWVGLAAALVPASILVGLRKELRSSILSSKPRFVSALTIVIVLFVAGPVQHRMEQRDNYGFDERKTDLSTTASQVFAPAGARGRLIVWRRTLDMIVDHPLSGVGLGGWMFHYPPYDRGEWITRYSAPQRPHNDFLWILSETGVVGLALYAWILGLIGTHLWRTNDIRGLGMLTGAVAYLGHSFFSFPRERVASTMLFWVVLGLVVSREPLLEKWRSGRWTLSGCVLLLLFGIGVSSRNIAFDKHFARAVNAWNREDWHSVVGDTNAAIEAGILNFRALQLNGLGNERLGRYDESIASFTRSLDYHPNEGHQPLGQVRERHGDPVGALQSYRNELSNYPNSVAAKSGIARVAAALGDSARNARAWSVARNYFTQALAYNSGNASLHNRRGESDLALGRSDSALAAFERAIALTPENPRYHNNAGVAARGAGDLERARTAYERAVSLDPAYARAYRNLGDVLVTAGDRPGAIDAYRRFIQHWDGDPAFTAQIRQKLDAMTIER